MQLKEKDQECRLNALKIKELKRAVRTTAVKLAPIEPNQRNSSGRRTKQQDKGSDDLASLENDNSNNDI